MLYTIYQITNTLDGKIYIGKHQTRKLDDGYMGSGKLIKRAVAKHGVENFRKEILFQFHTEAEMNAKEAELVTEEFCSRSDTYNLCPGGRGGFGYINTLPRSDGWKRKISERHGKSHVTNWAKMKRVGDIWITDGCANAKIRKCDSIPIGWRKGITKQRPSSPTGRGA